MDIVKSIDTSVDAVLDELDRAYFAVTLKVEFIIQQMCILHNKNVL
uniref:Non-structural protein 3a n=1 Tax=Coronaviridae TaxID=11118 RepID=Q66926_9NIDO|nr:ORF3a [Coronaviridae]